MPEWLVEQGIGERRAALVEEGRIIEARIRRDGVIAAGTVLAARLTAAAPRNAVARAGGQDYLLPRGAPGFAEGAAIAIEVSREILAGAEPWKRPLAKLSADAPRPAADIDGRLLTFPAPRDVLDEAGWSDLLDEARSGIVGFAGGELRISLTPAMTLIDVDGRLPAEELALAGASAAAAAIRRHGIGGSVGVDLPTVGGKAARQAIAEAFDLVLPQPYERTAVNGFGFIQIVRPRRFASLFELAAERAPFEARSLLRRAAREGGAVRLVAAPAVVAVLEDKPTWIEALARQVGGAVALRSLPGLAMASGYAEPA